MAIKEFEDCLAYIEHQLGIQLFGWQKEVLKKIYENKNGCLYIVPRRCGMTMLRESAELLENLLQGE